MLILWWFLTKKILIFVRNFLKFSFLDFFRFGWAVPVFAFPLWVLELAFCSYLALATIHLFPKTFQCSLLTKRCLWKVIIVNFWSRELFFELFFERFFCTLFLNFFFWSFLNIFCTFLIFFCTFIWTFFDIFLNNFFDLFLWIFFSSFFWTFFLIFFLIFFWSFFWSFFDLFFIFFLIFFYFEHFFLIFFDFLNFCFALFVIFIWIFLELIKASIEFCERGGDVLVKIRNGEDIGQRSKGTHDDVAEGDIGGDDPVTMGDTESHKRMTYGFKKFFPTIHVVSEEHTDSPDLSTVAAPSLRNREVCFKLFFFWTLFLNFLMNFFVN